MNNITSNQHMNFLEFRASVEAQGGLYNDDLVHVFLPLLKQLTSIYDSNKVANLSNLENLTIDDNNALQINLQKVSSTRKNSKKLAQITKSTHGIFEVTGREIIKTTVGTGEIELEDGDIKTADDDAITRPAYFMKYTSYEEKIDHYDQKTELFICGLLMASLAFNLDFNNEADFNKFVSNRKQLYLLNKNVHPT